nr:O-antigen ligase family protein [uncultured Desulfobacter sp.]
MALTSLLWICSFLLLALMSFISRPVWSIILYLMVYFFHPNYWWWGRAFRSPSLRWSLFAGIICIIVYFYNRYVKADSYSNTQQSSLLNSRVINALVLGLALNYVFVHFLLAEVPIISEPLFSAGLKFLILFVLMRYLVQSTEDLFKILIVVLLSLGYLGYQIKMNGVGQMVSGRIEFIPLPSAENSNFAASLIILFLPSLGAYFFCVKNKIYKAISLLALPFVVNLLLLCSSRSAWLGTISGGLFLVGKSKKKEWRILFIAILLALVGLSALARDGRIFERFESIFIEDNDQRDSSASNRLIFWQAGLEVIRDYPLGSGGNAFKEVRSIDYLPKYGYDGYKAVHNGYLAFTINWGIQGMAMYLLLAASIVIPCIRASNYLLTNKGLYHESFLGKTLVAGFIAFSVDGVFSNTIDNEWGIWMLALMYAYTVLVQKQQLIIR